MPGSPLLGSKIYELSDQDELTNRKVRHAGFFMNAMLINLYYSYFGFFGDIIQLFTLHVMCMKLSDAVGETTIKQIRLEAED